MLVLQSLGASYLAWLITHKALEVGWLVSDTATLSRHTISYANASSCRQFARAVARWLIEVIVMIWGRTWL